MIVSENIKSINPYVPGKPIEELERELGISGSIKLASNENPLGPSSKAVAAAKKALEGLNRYPDGSGFYLAKALATRYGVEIGQIILGNGSNELIELAVRTFVQPGDEVVSAVPSFVVYKMIVQAAGGTNIIVPCREYTHDLDAMAERITPRTRIVFIANPNNPTGTMNTKAELDRFMGRVPDHVLVALDEAYGEYVTRVDYPDALDYLREGNNVLALRTFSKIYGLAGLRIGYGITTAEIAGLLNNVRQPFNTNSLGQAAALAALADRKHVERSIAVNNEGKKYLYQAFEQLGVSYVPTETNFIFFETGRDCGDIYDTLLRKGVIIRPMGGKRLRVTIGLDEENKRFIAELDAALKS
ncbi:MAG: histidinol-phosphate transaminase [Nitrospirae bacterium GWC2_57_13]|jgi:histidinol-phosphate aminotransferase|nr:MAG: histidinol-phosphate transaminase [Nitrospirae bacterium GWC2_57_13]HAS54382.1 histidinol-phosphate transaminase [Nitrospiraceae bacterium]